MRTPPTPQATARYSYEFNKVLLLYSVVIFVNYLVVFISLIVCYAKILRYIQSLKKDFSKLNIVANILLSVSPLLSFICSFVFFLKFG